MNHYTVSKKRRHTDAYTPGGEMGKRPDYATIVYCNLIRKKYKDAAIVAGGIEASLRRLAHYDYWSNKLKHSILVDAQADIVIYGMGEHAIVEIADALQSGIDIKDLSFIHGTVYKARNLEHLYEDYIELPSYDALQEDKLNYARSFKIQYDNTDHITAKILVEKYKDYQYVIQNPPAEPLMEQEMDEVYALPYTKTYHRFMRHRVESLRYRRSNSRWSATGGALAGAASVRLHFIRAGHCRHAVMHPL